MHSIDGIPRKEARHLTVFTTGLELCHRATDLPMDVGREAEARTVCHGWDHTPGNDARKFTLVHHVTNLHRSQAKGATMSVTTGEEYKDLREPTDRDSFKESNNPNPTDHTLSCQVGEAPRKGSFPYTVMLDGMNGFCVVYVCIRNSGVALIRPSNKKLPCWKGQGENLVV